MFAWTPCVRARDRGFTLVEVLVVVIVVGVLTGVATPVYLSQRKKGVDASLRADLRALAQAQETYMADNPSTIGTEDPNDLTTLFRHGRGNIVYVSLNPPRQGYCLLARNLNDSGGGYPMYIMYDSLVGGFLNGGLHQDHRAPVGTGACGSGRHGFTNIP